MNSICFYRNDYSCVVNMRNFHSDPICYNEHEKKTKRETQHWKAGTKCASVPLYPIGIHSSIERTKSNWTAQMPTIRIEFIAFFSLYSVGELQINMILNCMPKCFFATATATNAVILEWMRVFNRFWAFWDIQFLLLMRNSMAINSVVFLFWAIECIFQCANEVSRKWLF